MHFCRFSLLSLSVMVYLMVLMHRMASETGKGLYVHTLATLLEMLVHAGIIAPVAPHPGVALLV